MKVFLPGRCPAQPRDTRVEGPWREAHDGAPSEPLSLAELWEDTDHHCPCCGGCCSWRVHSKSVALSGLPAESLNHRANAMFAASSL